MGNSITINLMYNSLNNKKEKEKEKKHNSSVEHCYCYHCKTKFKGKFEYNEHLQHCLNGDL